MGLLGAYAIRRDHTFSLCPFLLSGPFLQLWKNPHTLGRMVVFAIFGLAFCQITYLLAIQYSNAGTATIIQYAGPVLTVFFLCFLARRLPTKRELLALVCVVVGVFLLATHGNPAVMVLSPEVWYLLLPICSIRCYHESLCFATEVCPLSLLLF